MQRMKLSCCAVLGICCAALIAGLPANVLAQVPCPVADQLCAPLANQCTSTVAGNQCFAKQIIIDPAAPGGIRAKLCGCVGPNECGAITYIAANNSVRCVGACPVPPNGNECNVIIDGVPSNQPFVVITAYPPGTVFECGCNPTTPPPCAPNAAHTACNPTQCPPDSQGLPQTCKPVCIRVTTTGVQEIIDCDCMPDNQCHIEPGPIPGTPICVGTCPAGFICNRTETYNPVDGSTTYCCRCEAPPICEPDTSTGGTTCKQVTCPNSGEVCKPKCIEVSNNGVVTVLNCDCDSPNACHAEMGPAGPICAGICPPGYICIQHVYPTPNGTAYCCTCEQDPPKCAPTSDGQNCNTYICPPSTTGVLEHCNPRCVRVNPQTGQYFILDCDCTGDQECHVVLGPAPNVPHCEGTCPPGQFCVTNRVENADGTYTICCGCAEPPCDCPGDMDGNGIINGLDIGPFVRCFLGHSLPGDNCTCADINGDNVLDNLDIILFVNRILTKFQCSPTPCCPKANLNQNLATGVDDNGTVLPVNSSDPHWIVTLDPDNSTTEPRSSTVVNPHPSWVTFPNSAWVSADFFGPNGDYEYQFCFCVDPRAKNPILTFQARADDAGQVYLNGNFVGNTAGFSVVNVPAITVSNPSFFHPGQNCLVVKVQNIGGAPTGLNLVGTVSALDGKCCCPPQDLSKDISSGVYDNNGPLIPYGQDDDTWTVTCDATGGTVPRPAQTIVPHSAWAVIPGTRWISATTGATNGWYCYQYCFCLDPRFTNAALNMQLLADDYAEVYLNGTLVGQTPNGWAFLNPPTNIFVTNQALFRPCQNCIEIKVLNSGGVITGMDVKATITAVDGLCCDDRQYSCCMPDGTCTDLAPGVNQCPDGGQLMNGPCGPSNVSCCLPSGTCAVMPQRCCLVEGGTVLPAGTTCGAPVQACCLHIGAVTVCQMLDPACCTAKGGTPMGAGSVCLGDSNNDGNDDLCVPPPPVCPLGADFGSTICQSHQQSECVNGGTNSTCRPKIVITHGQGQPVTPELCTCFSGTGCGPVSITPTTGNNFIISCAGVCGPGAGCSLWVNGSPFAGGTVNSGSLPAGSLVECKCFIP